MSTKQSYEKRCGDGEKHEPSQWWRARGQLGILIFLWDILIGSWVDRVAGFLTLTDDQIRSSSFCDSPKPRGVQGPSDQWDVRDVNKGGNRSTYKKSKPRIVPMGKRKKRDPSVLLNCPMKLEESKSINGSFTDLFLSLNRFFLNKTCHWQQRVQFCILTIFSSFCSFTFRLSEIRFWHFQVNYWKLWVFNCLDSNICRQLE